MSVTVINAIASLRERLDRKDRDRGQVSLAAVILTVACSSVPGLTWPAPSADRVVESVGAKACRVRRKVD